MGRCPRREADVADSGRAEVAAAGSADEGDGTLVAAGCNRSAEAAAGKPRKALEERSLLALQGTDDDDGSLAAAAADPILLHLEVHRSRKT